MLLNPLYLLVGRHGVGKTTLAINMAAKSGKRLIVVDLVNNPSYENLPTIKMQDVPFFSQQKSFRIITPEPELAMDLLDKYHSNAFIICEDCGTYLKPNISNEANRFLKYHRHRNFDVALMFHYLQEVPPAVCKYYKYLLLFKTNDDAQQKLGKFSNWHIVKEKLFKVLQNTNYNAYEIISAI